MYKESASVLNWQYSMTWKLAGYTLEGITEEMAFWEPTKNSWNIRAKSNGLTQPDFIVPEPIPIPTPTIAWIMWHVLWWWNNAVLAVQGKPTLTNDQVSWSGSTADTINELHSLNLQWNKILINTTPDQLMMPVQYPWNEPKSLESMFAWVNSELMKNISEIGYIKHLYLNKS